MLTQFKAAHPSWTHLPQITSRVKLAPGPLRLPLYSPRYCSHTWTMTVVDIDDHYTSTISHAQTYLGFGLQVAKHETAS